MSQMKIFLSIFHISVAALNSYSIWYDQMYVDLPFPSKEFEVLPLKARYIFLTVWGLMLQIVYFSVSFLNDICGTDAPSPRHPPLIRRIKDILFSLAFTLALYVSLTFWGMYSFNKDLIFPHEIESRMPPWINHVMHSTIVPFILIEMFVTKRNYPSRKAGINLMMLFIFAYTMFVLYLYFNKGVWVYPFMDLLNWTMKFVFCVMSTGVALSIYVLGERLNSLVCPIAKSYANGVNDHHKNH